MPVDDSHREREGEGERERQREREREKNCPRTLQHQDMTKQNARQIPRSSVAKEFGRLCPARTESFAFLCERQGEHAGRCVSTFVAQCSTPCKGMWTGHNGANLPTEHEDSVSDFSQLGSRSKDGFDKLAPGQSMAYDAQRSKLCME